MGRGLNWGMGRVRMLPLGGDTLLLLFMLELLKVNVLEEGAAPLLDWSELLERVLDGGFFLGLSVAVDLERGLPALGINSATRRFAQGMPNSPGNFLSSMAIGEGELDRLPPGDTRPLCLSRDLQNGLEL